MNQNSERINEYYHILDEWLNIIERGGDITKPLKEKSISIVAIYGMGTMARHFITALSKEKINLCGVYDSKIGVYPDGLETKSITEYKGGADAIIYTNPFEEEDTLKKFQTDFQCEVIYLGDVIYDNLK